MFTLFDDHVGDGLCGVWSIEIGILLHLPLEVGSSDILDSGGKWVTSVEGWSAHDHDWPIENALNLDHMPLLTVLLVDCNVTVLDNGVPFDGFFGHELVEVLVRQKVPISFTIDLESPLLG
jgi:hypothetical protein